MDNDQFFPPGSLPPPGAQHLLLQVRDHASGIPRSSVPGTWLCTQLILKGEIISKIHMSWFSSKLKDTIPIN
jgi:hypothetical protein